MSLLQYYAVVLVGRYGLGTCLVVVAALGLTLALLALSLPDTLEEQQWNLTWDVRPPTRRH